MGHCLRVDLTLGFIFVSLGLFWRVSIVWLSKRGGGGGGREGGIASEFAKMKSKMKVSSNSRLNLGF